MSPKQMHHGPQSMCVYPTDRAYATAFFVSPLGLCHVPKPSAGISAPVLSLKCVAAMIESGVNFVRREKRARD